MKRMIMFFLTVVMSLQTAYSQSVQGNFQATAATVEYTYVARDSSASDIDVNSSLSLTVSWPSSAQPSVTIPVNTFQPGDTMSVQLVPLVTPELLAAQGVAVNVDFSDDGTFIINDGSTYPTTEEANCSTYSVVPNVAENGTWVSTPGFDHPDNPLVHSMGWGITLSSVFAQFNAADLVGGTLGSDYGPGTDMPNWGMISITYADEAHTMPTHLETYWEAEDGVSSSLGVDDDGNFNGYLGFPIAPGDVVTIPWTDDYLANYHPDTSLWWNLGWTATEMNFPMLYGPGATINPDDDSTFTVHPITGDTSATGIVAANRGYYFDPNGTDGIPFNGDEALAPTGYFMTFNFLEAQQVFSTVYAEAMGATGDLQGSLTAAADSVAFIYLDGASSAAIGAQVGSALYTEYVECLGTGASQELCGAIFEKGPTMSLGAVTASCGEECGVDDSYQDFNQDDFVGRLVFEVDNVCARDITTQRVNVFWVNTQYVEIDKSAPVASKFALHGNYPNPFNPSTKIKFSTEMTSDVSITIYNLLSEEIYTADYGTMGAGTYDIRWDGNNSFGEKVPSGLYFYQVHSGSRSLNGKMLLMK